MYVYGGATPEVRALCAARQLPLHAFAWQPQMQRAGLHRDGLYLVRPDGYVAFASPDQDVGGLSRFLDAFGLVVAEG